MTDLADDLRGPTTQPNRLEPLNLRNFTGGLNLSQDQFDLGETESPDMLNIEIDTNGGLSTRKGWDRWNSTAVASGSWGVLSGFVHYTSTGTYKVYLAIDDDTLWAAPGSAVFAQVSGATVAAPGHGTWPALWGDDLYLTAGLDDDVVKIDSGGTVSTLSTPNGSWNNDYTTPVGGEAIPGMVAEAHSAYLFIGHVREGASTHPNRIRWSHPNQPEDWHQDDYLDILDGGSKITALVSVSDHLLIFKESSVWALYGYDVDSWQLVRVSDQVGTSHPYSVSKSDGAVYFYSAAGSRGVYAYVPGQPPVLVSRKVRAALDQVTEHDRVHVTWSDGRLWVVVPWVYGSGAEASDSTILVFDPRIGDGAWVSHRPAEGYIGFVIRGARPGDPKPLAVLFGMGNYVAEFESIDAAYDSIDTQSSEDIAGLAYSAHYRTPWLHAGWPDRKKSWRRPTLIMRQPDEENAITISSYRDYGESDARRSTQATLSPDAAAYWNGFNWGDGTVYGGGAKGSVPVRVSSFGLAKALQLELRDTPTYPGRKWGVDAMILKYAQRRFR